MEELYIAIDGDDVGRRLEHSMLINDQDNLIDFSKRFNESMTWLESNLEQVFQAQIIFNGGDNLLAKLHQKDFDLDKLTSITKNFLSRSTSTLSIGIGANMRQAYFALKLAKTSGKNRICNYRELTNG